MCNFYTTTDIARNVTHRYSRGMSQGNSTDQKTSRLLTAQVAAKELGLPYTTTRELILNGTLPRVTIPGLRHLLVDRKDLDQLIERSRHAPDAG